MQKVNLIKFFDKFLGSFICFFLGLFNFKKDVEINRVLVIQLWGIGETVLTLPAISALRKKFPKSKIDILVTERNKDVYYENKDIGDLICIRLNPISIILFWLRNFRRYDVVIDMEEYLNISSIISFFCGKRRVGYSHNIRSRCYTDRVKYNDEQHCAQTFADLLKPLGVNFKANKLIRLNYSLKDQKAVDRLIPKNRFLIGITCGAAESAKSRMWPKENFSELVNGIIKKKKNVQIIFTGTAQEKQLVDEVINKIKEKNKVINLAGKMTLKQLFYFVSRCNLFISNDTGPMHIAAAQGVKTIGLFGPNLPVRFGPFNRKSVSLYKCNICKYSPCINVHKGEVPDCLYSGNSYQKCMKAIKVKEVLSEVF